MASDIDSVCKFVGTPFAYGGRGPDEYDCYGLLMECYRMVHGVEIMDYTSPTEYRRIVALMAGNLHLWEEVEEQPGCAMLLKLKGYGGHVGFLLDDGKFIHSIEQSSGVVIERVSTWRERIIGFYKYVGL